MSAFLVLLGVVVGQAVACGAEGTVVSADGKVAAGSISVAESEKAASVKKGHFLLDLGDAGCAVEITVLLDGEQPTVVKTPARGNVQVNFIKPAR